MQTADTKALDHVSFFMKVWVENQEAGRKFEAVLRTWGLRWETKYKRNVMLSSIILLTISLLSKFK